MIYAKLKKLIDSDSQKCSEGECIMDIFDKLSDVYKLTLKKQHFDGMWHCIIHDSEENKTYLACADSAKTAITVAMNTAGII